jgi:plastocyanin
MKGFTIAAKALVGACLALGLAAPTAALADGPKAEKVKLTDSCDKPTWDATFGPGICQRDAGSVTPAEWQSKMNPKDFGHGAWWINASGGRVGTTKLDLGDWLRVTNEGGEAHTFTMIEGYSSLQSFTGGCIPPLSDPLGLTRFAGDCGAALANTTVAPGKTVDFKGLGVGTYHFECLFHPWMRQTVQVRR